MRSGKESGGRWWSRAAWVACAVLAMAAASSAEDEEVVGLEAEALAERAIQLVDAGRQATLKAFLEHEDADSPWDVVEALWARDRLDVAAVVAQVSDRVEHENLPAYVASRRDRAFPREWWAVRKEVYEFRPGQRDGAVKVVALLEQLPDPPTSLTEVDLWDLEATALDTLGRTTEGEAARRVVVEAWRSLGNDPRLCGALHLHGRTLAALGRRDEAIVTLRESMALEEAIRARGGKRTPSGWSGLELGRTLASMGRLEEAVKAFDTAHDAWEVAGYAPGMALADRQAGLLLERMGSLEDAERHLERALAYWTSREVAATQAQLYLELASVRRGRDDYEGVQNALERARQVAAQLTPPTVCARFDASIDLSLAGLHMTLREPREALALIHRARETASLHGLDALLPSIEEASGGAYRALGEFERAIEAYERARRGFEGREGPEAAATAIANLGVLYADLRDYPRALDLYRQALALHTRRGYHHGIAWTLLQIGSAHLAQGALGSALPVLKQAVRAFGESGERRREADALRTLGEVQLGMGHYAEAIGNFERQLAIETDLGDALGMAEALNGIGGVYTATDRREEALDCYRRSLALRSQKGTARSRAVAIVNIGLSLEGLGAYQDALDSYRAVLEMLPGDRPAPSAVHAHLGLARLARQAGQDETARREYEAALSLAEALGNRRLALVPALDLAHLQRQAGRRTEARRALEDVRRRAERLRDAPRLVHALTELADLHLEAGEDEAALMTAREALPHLETILSGLGEAASAGARTTFASLFSIGAAAAARCDDADEVLYFLDGGRAGALLETLGGRRAMPWGDLSPELRQAEQEAHAAEARALLAYDRAVDAGGSLTALRAQAALLDAARLASRAVSARIQREAKRQAGVFYPRPATIEELQTVLRGGEVFVEYGIARGEALALVVGRADARIVPLGSSAPIHDACTALDASDPSKDTKPAVDRLRELLLDPLALGAETSTLLVSPVGQLCYVPWGLLAVERRVALSPSATTHVLLAADAGVSGQGVLALGDPDYGGGSERLDRAALVRGHRLGPLPGTRAEATAIGDRVLLGEEATASQLERALAERAHWRAVHLACHALVDTEHPLLSALALTRGPGDDGLLSALDVLRLQVPADLVALSACETARGRLYQAEGIVGLTRAFMYAGAPRVLSSLWKVPDEATRALMTAFYEIWNPEDGEGPSAAEALRRAQARVRKDPRWSHPHYWAAWVLWGLAS